MALLLLALLPLQLSWAAVGSYCQHESDSRAARHFGHHVHVHHDDAGQVSGKTMVDSDCAACHAGVPPLLAADAAMPAVSLASALNAGTAPVPPSAPAREPDRPQWPRLQAL